MSYILEALKKADRERAAGHVPDLETVHRHEPMPRRPYRWQWVLAALVVSNAALVALLTSRHDATSHYEAGQGTGDVARRAASEERIARNSQPAPPRAPVEIPPPVHPPPANVARIEPRIPIRQPETVASRQAPVMRSPTVRDTTVTEPAAIEPSTPSALATPLTATASGRIPDWDDLSLDFRRGFSTPRMDVHVYDPDPRRRFVLINLQKFREGDHLPNGAVLEEILQDGVVLSYQGTRFHYGK